MVPVVSSLRQYLQPLVVQTLYVRVGPPWTGLMVVEVVVAAVGSGWKSVLALTRRSFVLVGQKKKKKKMIYPLR